MAGLNEDAWLTSPFAKRCVLPKPPAKTCKCVSHPASVSRVSGVDVCRSERGDELVLHFDVANDRAIVMKKRKTKSASTGEGRMAMLMRLLGRPGGDQASCSGANTRGDRRISYMGRRRPRRPRCDWTEHLAGTLLRLLL